ncbi:methyltransferase domain-containing protein [Phytohabitans sp. ZYX-F-186]|uniref:Methyltransferase domain-containing protein n=1 Tax=Phytohabitans maris TaxID=3071409 RepID=A0ABU0ZVN2_9ACTN|nr:methyltransferase domain-containing protein [Phytohabitans sp. ZYX-F-186]MDQ7910866.1 methyltransferase domain-containing protein [Phytohabitans sp. ZYX-F-186]
MSEWDWGRPEELSARMDAFLVEGATCDKLEEVASPPYDRAALDGLGVTGVEFAAWKSRHPAALASDVVPLRAPDGVAAPDRVYRVDGEALFAALDIRRPLPFADGSVDWVYAEHLVEHVSLSDAIGWLTEVRRILAPGGVLRLTTPDLATYVDGYRQGSPFFPRHRSRLRAAGLGPPMPARRAFMFNQLFYLYGHRWLYDFDEMRYALSAAGFAPDTVERRSFRDGVRPDVADLDRVLRNDESLYVEVVKRDA